MHEKLVIVPKKKTSANKIFNIVWFALACLMLLMATFVNPMLFLLPAVLFGAIWYIQSFCSDIEYEYTYYDGEFQFARIKAKRKRKAIGSVQMEDVLGFAPKGDRSVSKYENVAVKNMTSGGDGARVYELIAKEEKGIVRYEFEPDDEMLDAVMVKYPRAVVR